MFKFPDYIGVVMISRGVQLRGANHRLRRSRVPLLRFVVDNDE
jgi:hypothetical protein